MSVGGVVDHAVALYRHSWRPFALLALLWWIPSLVSPVLDFGGPVNRALTDSAVWLEKQEASMDVWWWIGSVLDLVRFVLTNAAFTAAALSATAGSSISA